MSQPRPPTMLALEEAAAVLDLPAPAVEALVGSGYLVPARVGREGPEFPLSDIKAFVARNADNGGGSEILDRVLGPRGSVEAGTIGPQELLDALDGRSGEMARRVFQIFARVFPEAEGWSLNQQASFIEQAKQRFEAILAVTSEGADVDSALFDELRGVGASAAHSGSSLPQLLVILRISRDLVVQTAIELAEEGDRQGGLALSLLLTRVLPAMDRLTDAIAQGYWEAVVVRQEESQARYRHVVERASDGVYEVDTEGHITYANPAFALIVGRRLSGLEGVHLSEALRPREPGTRLEELLSERPPDAPSQVDIVRPDGVRRALSVQPAARFEDGVLVGFHGIVRDDTMIDDFDADRSEFAALLRDDLRTPLASIVGLGATLETHADELTAEQASSTGRAIRSQVERVSRLADDLSDIGQLRTGLLRLHPRPVELLPVVQAALDSVGAAGDDRPQVDIEVPDRLVALADPRRLEQVIANLVDNAFSHGSPPVSVIADLRDDEVLVRVVDHGPGVAHEQAAILFAGRQTPTREQRDRNRGRGIGLALVRGLAEAMGGRVWYEKVGDASNFVLAVPAPARGT